MLELSLALSPDPTLAVPPEVEAVLEPDPATRHNGALERLTTAFFHLSDPMIPDAFDYEASYFSTHGGHPAGGGAASW